MEDTSLQAYTVKLRLMGTPQQWTPMKVLTVLSFTSILKQHLNSGHPATPYNSPNCTQTILNDPDLADTRLPFHQDCPPSQLDIRSVLLLIVLASV